MSEAPESQVQETEADDEFDHGPPEGEYPEDFFDVGEDIETGAIAQIDEYDINSSPNDFNITTIVNFIESGAIEIPGFQRNFVWDIRRSSKLIESILIGLPIPQIFLYERERNKFLVIDGQQRLMSIFYFAKQRFPRKQQRSALRRIFAENDGIIPDEIFLSDEYFQPFRLSLPKLDNGKANKFHRLTYTSLDEYSSQFDLRTIRNVIIRQLHPTEDDSSIYEMFSRLNTGGVNLRPQEIRASLYHSEFYSLLFRWNHLNSNWRKLVGRPEPDLHMKDIEALLRSSSMFVDGEAYRPSMASFLNKFSKKAAKFTSEQVSSLERELVWFFDHACSELPADAFQTREGRFSVTLLESVFGAAIGRRTSDGDGILEATKIVDLRDSSEFRGFTEARSGDTANVKGRLALARNRITLS